MAYQDNELKDIKAFTLIQTKHNDQWLHFQTKITRLLTNHLRENLDTNIDNYYEITQVKHTSINIP